jgi:hypothetical protein
MRAESSELKGPVNTACSERAAPFVTFFSLASRASFLLYPLSLPPFSPCKAATEDIPYPAAESRHVLQVSDAFYCSIAS